MLAAELARRSEMPVVSSDIVRKRLAHLAPDEPAHPEHYTAPFTLVHGIGTYAIFRNSDNCHSGGGIDP